MYIDTYSFCAVKRVIGHIDVFLFLPSFIYNKITNVTFEYTLPFKVIMDRFCQ